MRLVGMLDSPYVRRAAISFTLMGFAFELSQISVFRGFDEFKAINPVVKAPTLVTDAGVVLMDSGLILDYAERVAGPAKSLMPSDPDELAADLHAIGLALAACEKTVQIVYERNLRPAEKQHDAWLDRIKNQLLSAYDTLEPVVAEKPRFTGARLSQADITMAVAWRFTQHMAADVVPADAYPRLAAHSAHAEILPVFAEFSF